MIWFKSVVIACAVNSGSIDMNICIDLQDTFGPFKTEENCNIRNNQIKKEVIETQELREDVFVNLMMPEEIALRGICIPIQDDKYES